MKFGLIWSVALLWCGDAVVAAVVAPEVALMCRGLVVGSVVSVNVAVLAARGFFDPVACDGADFVSGSAGDFGQRVLNNRIAQGVLALCIWAAAGFSLVEQALRDRGSVWLWPRGLWWHGDVSGVGITAH